MKSKLKGLTQIGLAIGVAFVLSACSPNVTGSYRGGVRNNSYDITSDLFINLVDSGGTITGTMTIGAPLSGGGDVNGKREKRTIQFVTADSAGGRIVWIGHIDGKVIQGEYVVEPSAMTQVLAGVGKQQGVWSVQYYQ